MRNQRGVSLPHAGPLGLNHLASAAADPTLPAAHALNLQIRRLARMLAGCAYGDHSYGFMCECGCDATVPLTLAEFDGEGGAWFAGHRPL